MGQGTAVLITCYNRRETTLRCLDALFRQQLPAGYNLATYRSMTGVSIVRERQCKRPFPMST